VSAPVLVCAGTTVHAAWEDTRDGELDNPNVYYSRSTDGGATWPAQDMRVSDDPDGKSQSLGPDLVVAGDHAYLAWFDDAHGAFDILLAASADAGAHWRAPERLDGGDPGAAWSGWPRIVADDAGHVTVVWQDTRSGGADLYARTSPDAGVTLFPEVRIDGGDDPGSHDSFRPRVASDGDHVYVVWHDTRDGDQRDVFFNWSGNHGQNWATAAVRVDSDAAGAYDSIAPDVVVHGDTATFAWQDARSSAYDIYVRQAQVGVFYDPEARVDRDAPGAANSLNARILQNHDTIAVVWEDRRGDAGQDYDDLFYNYSRDGGQTWATTDLSLDSIAPGTSYKLDFQPVLSDGVLYVAWEDGRNGTSDIYFQALPVGEQAGYVTE